LDGAPKAWVFAYTDELDRWLAEKPFYGNLRAFLEVWKNADPIFPEIGDARRRLDTLLAK
jgi:hypothetical protein